MHGYIIYTHMDKVLSFYMCVKKLVYHLIILKCIIFTKWHYKQDWMFTNLAFTVILLGRHCFNSYLQLRKEI